MPRNLRIASVLVALLGCGAAAPEASTGSTASALTCGSEPHDNGDGTATTAACAWEQQYANIVAHGEALPSGEVVVAGNGATSASATRSCGAWILGNDAQGVVVFLNRNTGEVRSHGTVHLGFATSSLASTLPSPLLLR